MCNKKEIRKLGCTNGVTLATVGAKALKVGGGTEIAALEAVLRKVC